MALIAIILIACIQYGQCWLSEGERQEAVDLHNQYRIEAAATAMQKLNWNYELENVAQRSADKCIFEHTTYEERSNVAGFSYIGENIYTTSGAMDKPTLKQAIDDWASEKKDYYLDTDYCSSSMCLHYTQIVWSPTTDVGCAIAQCDSVHSFTDEPGYIIFCNYGIGGNMIGEKLYEKASNSWEIGSKCQEVFKKYPDSNGLCDTDAPASNGDQQEITGNESGTDIQYPGSGCDWHCDWICNPDEETPDDPYAGCKWDCDWKC